MAADIRRAAQPTPRRAPDAAPIAAALSLILAAAPSQAPPPSIAGQWSAPASWGVLTNGGELAHAALLLTAVPPQVLLWQVATPGLTVGPVQASLMSAADPSVISPIAPPTHGITIFCSSHTFLPDGRLMLVGGLPNFGLPLLCCHEIPSGLPPIPTAFAALYALLASPACRAAATVIYDPVAASWLVHTSETPQLGFSRYYPTATTTSSGYPVVYGGTLDAICPAAVGFQPTGALPFPPSAPPYSIIDGKYVSGYETYAPPPVGGAAAWNPSPGSGFVDVATDALPLWPGYTDYVPATYPETSYFRYYPRGHLLAKQVPGSATEPEILFVGGDTHVEWKVPPPDVGFAYGGFPIRQPENVLRSSQFINLATGTVGPANAMPNGTQFATPPTPSPPIGCGPITTNPPNGCYASSVILHTREGLTGTLNKNRILAFAGGHGPANVSGGGLVGLGTPTVMEWDDQTYLWRGKQPLVDNRVFQNAVVLPTREILIVGGYVEDHSNYDGSAGTLNSVDSYELYGIGPDAGTCGAVASWARPHQLPNVKPVPRGYHSMAFLIPDGRVVLCGGTDDGQLSQLGGVPPNDSYEIYSPPYMFNPRPVIKTAPPVMGYGINGQGPLTLVVQTKQASQLYPGNFAVVLMRPASLTHHFDPDQRYLELEIPVATSDPANPSKWTLQVNPPSDPSLMPPGYYMLFFRAGAAVSTSASVRLQ